MTPAFWYTSGPALLYVLAGVMLGWALRDAKLWWEARQFAKRFRRAMDRMDAIDRRERRARNERRETWHIEAPDDATAWDAFHRRTLLGVEGRP